MAVDQFLLITGRQYDSMRNRFKAKYDAETGKLRKAGRAVPFTKEHYRNWVRLHLEQRLWCEYCECALALDKMQPDHIVPVKRGGSLGLENLAPSCPRCNSRKGELTGDEFRAFTRGLATFPEAARSYIYRQMSMRPVFRPHTGSGGPKPRPKLTSKNPEGASA